MPRLYEPENSNIENLEILKANPNPGRFDAVGVLLNGEPVLATAITGRSPGSKNRGYTEEDNIVSTEVLDLNGPKGDPVLTIYDAHRHRKGFHVAGNGDQVDTVLRFLRAGMTFEEAMEVSKYEPDREQTPRITAFFNLDAREGEARMGISVIRKAPDSDESIREYYSDTSDDEGSRLHVVRGLAYAVHTYLGDGPTPVPSYDEPPFTIPATETVEDFAKLIWENINPDVRVAVAAKSVGKTGMKFSIQGNEL